MVAKFSAKQCFVISRGYLDATPGFDGKSQSRKLRVRLHSHFNQSANKLAHLLWMTVEQNSGDHLELLNLIKAIEMITQSSQQFLFLLSRSWSIEVYKSIPLGCRCFYGFAQDSIDLLAMHCIVVKYLVLFLSQMGSIGGRCWFLFFLILMFDSSSCLLSTSY